MIAFIITSIFFIYSLIPSDKVTEKIPIAGIPPIHKTKKAKGNEILLPYTY